MSEPEKHSLVEAEAASRPQAEGVAGSGELRTAQHGFKIAEREVKPKAALGTITLLALLYSHVCGSAFGSEDAVGAGGAAMTIILIILLPFIQGFPFALVCTELSSAIPSNAGYLMWFNVAFNPIVYFTTLQMAILNNVVDTALYPVIFSEYTCQIITCNAVGRGVLKVGLLVFCGILNAIGVEFVGVGSVIITVMSLAPFYLLFAWQGFTGGFNWSRLTEVKTDINWTVFLPTLSWNFMGQESIGAVVEEVHNPQKTLIRAMVPLMVLLWLTYIPPIMSAVSSQPKTDWSVWTNGYYAVAAEATAGSFGKYLITIAGVVSAIGLTMSAICICGRMIAGMGQAKAFPQSVNNLVSYHSPRFQTPVVAIAISTLVSCVASTLLNFERLVGIDQVTYGITIILIFLVFIRLRITYPKLERPFRVPLPTPKAIAMTIIPMCYCVVLSVVALVVDWFTFVLCVGLLTSFLLISVVYVRLFKPFGFEGAISSTHREADLSPSELEIDSRAEA